MPYIPGLGGVTKTLKVNNAFVLASDATDTQEMEVQPKRLIQGTPNTRILNIGKIERKISINAPILVGGGALIDGRTLLSAQVANALNVVNPTLPVLESATIKVSEEGATVALQLVSDGNPANAGVFVITAYTASDLASGSTSDLLNPSTHPTREAVWYDFRVNLAGIYMFVKSATINLKVDLGREVFIAGKPTSSPYSTNIPSPNPNNWGTQYPTFFVQGIGITGSGEAAVELIDTDGDHLFNTQGEAINVTLGGGLDVTVQTPGCCVVANAGFTIEIWNCTAGDWEPLFVNTSTGDPLFDLSAAVINESAFHITTGLLMKEFQIVSYLN